jgi:hypothetical protein
MQITTGTLRVMRTAPTARRLCCPSQPTRSSPSAWLAGCVLLVAAITLPGCSIFGPSERSFERSTERYSGPSVSITAIDSEHHVVVTAQSPGFAIHREGSQDTIEGVDVFITIRRPDPAFQYPQVMVDQTLATGVATTEPMRVFVRTLRHDDTDSERPYAQAASTQ